MHKKMTGLNSARTDKNCTLRNTFLLLVSLCCFGLLVSLWYVSNSLLFDVASAGFFVRFKSFPYLLRQGLQRKVADEKDLCRRSQAVVTRSIKSRSSLNTTSGNGNVLNTGKDAISSLLSIGFQHAGNDLKVERDHQMKSSRRTQFNENQTRAGTNVLIPSNPRLQLPRNSTFIVKGRWLPLDKNNPYIFVYAAYFDDVEHIPFVRLLLSLYMRSIRFAVMCLWYEVRTDNSLTLVGHTKGFCSSFHQEPGGLRYNRAFVKCPLIKPTDRPYAVSVLKYNASLMSHSTNYSKYVTTILRVYYSGVDIPTSSPDFQTSSVRTDGAQNHSIEQRIPPIERNDRNSNNWSFKWNITKCYPAFHGFTNVMQLIQQIELSRLFGVEHFVFYMLKASKPITLLLQYYQNMGIAEVQDWQYPGQMKKARYYHQVTAEQDCLYRNLRSTRFLLFGDVDEIFTPRSSDHLLTVLTELHAQKPMCGSFLFLNVFFASNPRSKLNVLPQLPETDFARQHKLTALTGLERLGYIFPPGTRSKQAVLPERVDFLEVHQTEKFRGQYTDCPIPNSTGLLHHYRQQLPGLPKNVGFVTDSYMVKFAAQIVSRVKRVLDDMRTVKTFALP